MKWHFRFSEFTTLEDESFLPTNEVTDKIIKGFMIPLQFIRMEIEQPIYIRSCYRPVYWEKKQGRDGSSQHTFKGEGAVDASLTPNSQGSAKGWDKFFKGLDAEYQRICWYPEQRFFHCDNKGFQKLYFIGKDWQVTDRETILQTIA